LIAALFASTLSTAIGIRDACCHQKKNRNLQSFPLANRDPSLYQRRRRIIAQLMERQASFLRRLESRAQDQGHMLRIRVARDKCLRIQRRQKPGVTLAMKGVVLREGIRRTPIEDGMTGQAPGQAGSEGHN
jgi:hypothetical protein